VAFHRVVKTVKFPRNEHVEVHVRRVVLNNDAPEAERVDAIEIREFIKAGEVYGHGLVIPAQNDTDLIHAIEKVME
jgi:hypothetical protein